MERIHITKKPKNYDNINNLDLRSDIENNNIFDCYLSFNDRIINVETSDSLLVCTYLYESDFEYKQDLEILGFNIKNK